MKPLNPMASAEHPITRRMLENRGLTLVRYRSEDEVRHGWIVSEEPKELRIQLIGNERVTCVRGDDRRYVEVMPWLPRESDPPDGAYFAASAEAASMNPTPALDRLLDELSRRGLKEKPLTQPTEQDQDPPLS